MKLSYQNYTLHEATLDDVYLLTEWWNDGNIMAHAGFPKGLNIESHEIEKIILKNSIEKAILFIIRFGEKSIGETNYRVCDNKEIEIGIKIVDEESQNKGIGTIVIHILLRFLYLQGHRIINLDTNLNNLRAQHFYEKIGFTKEKTENDSWCDQNGKLQSSVFYKINLDRYCFEESFIDNIRIQI